MLHRIWAANASAPSHIIEFLWPTNHLQRWEVMMLSRRIVNLRESTENSAIPMFIPPKTGPRDGTSRKSWKVKRLNSKVREESRSWNDSMRSILIWPVHFHRFALRNFLTGVMIIIDNSSWFRRNLRWYPYASPSESELNNCCVLSPAFCSPVPGPHQQCHQTADHLVCPSWSRPWLPEPNRPTRAAVVGLNHWCFISGARLWPSGQWKRGDMKSRCRRGKWQKIHKTCHFLLREFIIRRASSEHDYARFFQEFQRRFQIITRKVAKLATPTMGAGGSFHWRWSEAFGNLL